MTNNPENQHRDETQSHPSDPTAALPVDDSTARESGSTARSEGDDQQASQTATFAAPPVAANTRTTEPASTSSPSEPAYDSPTGPASALPRPTGPHAPAIVLGLVCLVVAGLVLAQELGTLSVDWGNVGPLGIVAAGALLVVLGLVGLLSSRRSG